MILLAGCPDDLTDTEIRNAIEEDDDESVAEEADDESDEYEISDSEEDVLETASELEDEIGSITPNEDDGDGANTSDLFIGKDGTEWSSKPPNAQGRTSARNIIRGKVNAVVLPPGKHIDHPVDAFALFFTDEIVNNNIVKYTNLQGTNTVGTKWKMTDTLEIRAFIGLLIDAGLRRQGGTFHEEFWDPLFGSPIYRACMSKNRFVAILRHLRFDDKTTRSSRRAQDKLAPIRDIWNDINKNLRKHYLPGNNLTIDEQLVPFRGRVSFRQYIPSKPDKYGMKMRFQYQLSAIWYSVSR